MSKKPGNEERKDMIDGKSEFSGKGYLSTSSSRPL